MSVIKYRHVFEIMDAKNEYIGTLYAEQRHGFLWFTSLWVHGDHRRKGLGKQLLDKALLELGHQTIYLQVLGYTDQPLSDKELIAWYGRFGFRSTDVPGVLMREARR